MKITRWVPRGIGMLWRIAFVSGPFAVIAFIVLVVIRREFDGTPSAEFYRLVIAAIGIAATLAGLSFRYAEVFERDERDWQKIVGAGQRWLIATILIIAALMLKYGQTVAEAYAQEHLRTGWVKTLLSIYFRTAVLLFFSGGAMSFVSGLEEMHDVFYGKPPKMRDRTGIAPEEGR